MRPYSLLPAKPDGAAIRAAFLADERATVERRAEEAAVEASRSASISGRARTWVEAVRARLQEEYDGLMAEIAPVFLYFQAKSPKEIAAIMLGAFQPPV